MRATTTGWWTARRQPGCWAAAALLALFSAPALAGPADPLFGPIGAGVLALQSGLFVHLLTSSRIQSCYKTVYGVFYLLAFIGAWTAALVILDQSGRLLLSIAILTLAPAAVWLYALTKGRHLQHDSLAGNPTER